MSSRWIFLRPIDRVYFGPPRAQAAGEVHGGRSLFPPSSYTTAGMVRTRLLEGAEPALNLNDWSFAERERRAALVGTAEALPSEWQMVGPFPACETSDHRRRLAPWLPLPAWITCAIGGRLMPHRLLAQRGRNIASTVGDFSYFTPMADDDGVMTDAYWVGSPRVKPADNSPTWVPTSVLDRILTTGDTLDVADEAWFLPWKERRASEVSDFAGPPFVKWDTAPGVAISSGKRSAVDGMLYTLEMLRFAPGSGLLVSLSASLTSPLRGAALEDGVGRAGRKGQTAAFESATDRLDASWSALIDSDHLRRAVEREELFWLYLGTPAKIANPYKDVLSAICDEAPKSISIELLSVMIGAPQVIGGLAADGGRPRENALYARPGSGWLLRVKGGRPEERLALLNRFHGRSSLGPKKEQAFGFGFTLVGRGPQEPSAEPAPGARERS